MNCKITNKKLTPIMSFGQMPIANGFLDKDNFSKEFFFEMSIGFSDDLSLLQLMDHPKPEMMFNKNYPFFTSSSKYMIDHFEKYSDWITNNYPDNNKKLIEIGSNDGTFLSSFKRKNFESIGFEPSSNVSDIAEKKGLTSINEFFNTETVKKFKNFLNQTDVICAANVICHVPELGNLFQAVDLCLNKNGIFIFEEPYMGSMFSKISYDQIYDEHIYMFSASSISKICKLYDMELVNVIKQNTHGGSLRYICARKDTHKINSNVHKLLEEEKNNNLDNVQSCFKFKQNCEESKLKLRKKLHNFKSLGKKICGYAATSKSTTILNYCDIGHDVIDYICDTTKEKIGKFSPGKHIPIKSMDYFYKNLPDVAFLFAWNHKKEIFEKEKQFSKTGEWTAHVEL
jgi:2-polyprenyl-3-methyl-5-hydroxy-6-metoxy-1,4-benzoquinol methylase